MFYQLALVVPILERSKDKLQNDDPSQSRNLYTSERRESTDVGAGYRRVAGESVQVSSTPWLWPGGFRCSGVAQW